MERTPYDAEHEDLRTAARELLDRHVVRRHEEFVAAKAIPRDVWIEAGKQGLLGLQIPEEHGGGGVEGDYRFTTVEYRVARAWRDARVTKIWAGSNETMKELIGRELGL